MAGRPLPAGALPPQGWPPATSASAARRVARGTHLLVRSSSQNDCVLVVSWLLAALRSSGPYPVLAISGEQGSAKTVLSKMLRALVDPNVAPVRALPRDERELFVAADNAHVLAFDNVSGLRPWLSDALCRLASGGGFAVRRLYTDQDEVLFDAARPVILNGIEEVITRPDLADRSIFLTLPPVADARRQPERELWRQFELARSGILGALLDLVVHGLRILPDVGMDRLPRMADFAIWAAACEPALWRPGTFHRAYEANRRAAIDGIIDADPVAACVREIMAERSSWIGSAADLLRAGAERGVDGILRDRTGWPQNPRAIAGRLRRAQSFLRVLGIDITFSRGGRDGSRIIRMRAHSKVPSAPSAPPRFRTRALNKPPPRWISDICEDNCRPSGQPIVPSGRFPTRADDADGADANSTLMKSRRMAGPSSGRRL